MEEYRKHTIYINVWRSDRWDYDPRFYPIIWGADGKVVLFDSLNDRGAPKTWNTKLGALTAAKFAIDDYCGGVA